MPEIQPTQRVDATALRVNQICIVLLVALSFILGTPSGTWLLALVALGLAVGAAFPGYGPFQLLYHRILRPAGLLKPNLRPDDPRPHRFSQTLGAAVLTLAAVTLIAGWDAVGWALGWIVVALALVNLLFGFCAGCFAFYQIQRLRHGVRGSAA